MSRTRADPLNRYPGIKPGRVVAFGMRDESQGTEKLAERVAEQRAQRVDEDRLKRDIREIIEQCTSSTRTTCASSTQAA
jgi:hypothetical protein